MCSDYLNFYAIKIRYFDVFIYIKINVDLVKKYHFKFY